MRTQGPPYALASPQGQPIEALFKSKPEDFEVHEIPAYPPSGTGEHIYIHIEKRGIDTIEAIRRLSRALKLSPTRFGHAGMKDRHALSTQWLSIHAPLPSSALGKLALPGLRILEISRHRNKLRAGHLRANRFCIVLR
ncbi:MAG: tRNA pseudouridine(13) synthase TruD, partial [Deltaproteobacteria bacterium]|nr:tRNA pseudouridine(13) synthase TruD [Deltaproteobacteria bacterium]